jgi:hypothetical protein
MLIGDGPTPVCGPPVKKQCFPYWSKDSRNKDGAILRILLNNARTKARIYCLTFRLSVTSRPCTLYNRLIKLSAALSHGTVSCLTLKLGTLSEAGVFLEIWFCTLNVFLQIRPFSFITYHYCIRIKRYFFLISQGSRISSYVISFGGRNWHFEVSSACIHR